MKGVFDYRDVEEPASRDTELTLGSTTLLLIFLGLILLCGLCFGLGYATGRHATQETAAALPGADQVATAAPGDGGRAKPSADVAGAGEAQPASEPDQSAAPAAASSAVEPETPQVKPALENGINPIEAGQQAAAGAVAPAMTPAMAPAATIMVQIAAISQQQDADVLMSALRRRGYAVVSHREALDGLIHVRIGPFKTRPEAEAWRQKLLNDGYNAIVQP